MKHTLFLVTLGIVLYYLWKHSESGWRTQISIKRASLLLSWHQSTKMSLCFLRSEMRIMIKMILPYLLFNVSPLGILMMGIILLWIMPPVHTGLASFEAIFNLLAAHGVQLILLPKYSPELNPCELVFNVLKTHIRHYRLPGSPLWLEICKSIATIDVFKMLRFYDRCVTLRNVILKNQL